MAAEMVELAHPAIGGGGVPLGDAVLTDRQRLGVLLQGAAILSLQAAAGCRLGCQWSEMRIDSEGLLRSVVFADGRDDSLPQTLLTELAKDLFQVEERVGGRGEARRATRKLMHAWRQELHPLAADRAVKMILEEAEFLWESAYSHVRSTLAGEFQADGEQRLWVAGPRRFRSAVLSRAQSLEQAREILSAQSCRRLWEAEPRRQPQELTDDGHWRRAVKAWEALCPEKPAQRLAFARSLTAIGRFEAASQQLHRLRSREARILRAFCLCRRGKLKAADREIRKLAEQGLRGDALLDTASVAIRLYSNTGAPGRAQWWVRKAVDGVRGERRQRAYLLAAGAAWDEGRLADMQERLNQAVDVGVDVETCWRWNKARGQLALGKGDGRTAVTCLEQALRVARRELSPLAAGELWNELALARSLGGDLAGAERALCHVVQLHRDVEGPRLTTLARFNLAEIRLRRGRLHGVQATLEESTRENLLAENWRGYVHDVELWARWEFVRGQPNAALSRLQMAIRDLTEKGVDWRQGVLRALMARTLGWLRRPEEALRELESAGDAAVMEFEPEERPALWALAGDHDRALQAVSGDMGELWRAVLSGGRPDVNLWGSLDTLEGFRAARLVFDVEAVAPGSVPPDRLRRATATFRRLGANALAERLEHGDQRTWTAVRQFLEQGREDRDSLQALFAAGGYPDARLILRHQEGDQVVVDGLGGTAEISAPVRGGSLRLTAAYVDAALRTLFQLAVRAVEEQITETTEPRASAHGIVGESDALRQAFQRLQQLAPENVPILILGETGTGKELMAKAAHALSPHGEGQFVVVNCAAVSEELLLSELFGHARGSFTGAVKDRVGMFETARGGTVFLDEIGDLPLRAQGFLLRVLQEGEVRRIGESLPRPTDARVVAATHRNLEEMVKEGEFRADLFFRLKVACVDLPPLRERGDDVLLLAEHFLRRLRPAGPPTISPAAKVALRGHRWPGNVRELENVLSVAVAVAGGGPLLPEHLDLPYAHLAPQAGYHEQVLNFRRGLVQEALSASGGNRSEAARRLGLTRQALSYLVHKLGVGP